MPDEASNDPETRFLERVERRARFLKLLFIAELGIYLSPDEQQRKRTIEGLVRMIARQSELPHLRPEALNKGYEIVLGHLEAMQRVLPHDVQYRNRLRRNW
jgi:hypothetical protein